AGLALYTATQPDGMRNVWVPGLVLVGVAAAGWLASLGLGRLRPARPEFAVPLDPVRQSWIQLKLLGESKPLMRAALGIAFFWTLATLTQANVKVFGQNVLQLSDDRIGGLMLALVIGIGAGSLLAGYWSGGRVELGIVPLGGVGIVVCSMALYLSGGEINL